MLTTLAIQNYRSLLKLVMPLGRLNVITGPNGSGKSNLYRALRLLAETAQGGITSALAREGGLQSTLWAGPEKISAGMRKGVVPVQGVQRKEAVRLRLGYASKDLSYAISLGLPPPPSAPSMFSLDPEVKSEMATIWPWRGKRFARSAMPLGSMKQSMTPSQIPGLRSSKPMTAGWVWCFISMACCGR
jgi:predicted ATPase